MIREKQLWSSLASANSAQLRRICLKSNINLTLAYLNEVHLEKLITLFVARSLLFCRVKKNTLLMHHTCFVAGDILYMISTLVICSCRCSSSSRVHCSTGESSVRCGWAYCCSYLLLIFLIYKDVVRKKNSKLTRLKSTLEVCLVLECGSLSRVMLFTYA